MFHPSPTLASYTKNIRHKGYAYPPVFLQPKQSCWLKCAFLAVWGGGGEHFWPAGKKAPPKPKEKGGDAPWGEKKRGP